MTGARCLKCNKRPATVKVIRIVDGQATSILFCNECAAAMNPFLNYKFTLQDVIEQVLGKLVQKQEEAEELGPTSPTGLTGLTSPTSSGPTCPNCGMTFAAYHERFFLGCSQCYTAFSGLLEPQLRRLHGGTRHVGRSPRAGGKTSDIEATVAALSREMAMAISNEDFLKAAQLRDRIRHLKGELYHVVPEVPEM